MSVHKNIRHTLIECAKQRGHTISYTEIGKLAELNMDNIADRNRLAEILGDISSSEHDAGRPLLSVLVVHGGDDSTQMPGKGFFNLARGASEMKPEDDELAFFIQELNRVNDYWSKR